MSLHDTLLFAAFLSPTAILAMCAALAMDKAALRFFTRKQKD